MIRPRQDLDIVYVDNHLLAVNKQSGLPSQPDASGDPSLVDTAKRFVKERYGKPGDVYLALLHRLDRPTSGIVLMARTSKAAARMAEQFRLRQIEKTYFALVHCHAVPAKKAELHNHLVPGANGGMRVTARGPSAKEARLFYVLLEKAGDKALLQISLETGVKHQIRCQLANAGLPVVGDFRYGPAGRPARPDPVIGGRAILLHAAKLAFIHPVRKEPVSLTAAPPEHWLPFLRYFQGGWQDWRL